MADKQVQDILFEYLKNIIYSPEKAHLDLEELPEEFQDLGQGMLFLGQCVLEQKVFGKSLIKGDFEHDVPSIENGIAAPLKEVHGILKHLMWQSKEVAKGDYSQRLDYFGDLSEAFNSMVSQLKEREGNLLRKNRELSNLQEMFKNITVEAPYYIFSLRREDDGVTYLNKKADALSRNFPELYLEIYKKIVRCYENTLITIDDPDVLPRPGHYQIMTTSNPDDEIRVYMVINVTDEFSKTLELEKIAFVDELTGLRNRRYGQGVMQDLMRDDIQFSVAFIDIDHLKYCNDVFGHEKGDEYIKEVSQYLLKLPGDKTICRVGGDEFIIIRPGIKKEPFEAELLEKYQHFLEEYKLPFQKSFSFGVADSGSNNQKEVAKILEDADKEMYEYKLKHKQKIDYEDDRL